MHSLLHTEYQRAVVGTSDHKRMLRAQAASVRPQAPPGRLRAALAHALAASALRLDHDVARRAVV